MNTLEKEALAQKLIEAIYCYTKSIIELQQCIDSAYDNHGPDYTLDHVCASEITVINRAEQDLKSVVLKILEIKS